MLHLEEIVLEDMMIKLWSIYYTLYTECILCVYKDAIKIMKQIHFIEDKITVYTSLELH